MSRAELPENLHQAADAAKRYAAGQQNTEILYLPALEEVFAVPPQTNQVEQPVAPSYESMTKIQLLKHLSALDVSVRADPELKQYMDKTFPEGYAKTDPLLRLYSWDAFKSEKEKTEQDNVDDGVLEALNYQKRQLDARKINAAKAVWAENAADNIVLELEEQVQATYQRDMEAAYIENDQRQAQARAEVVKQRAVREIETYMELEVFIAACESANYSVVEIKNQKPEYAVFTLRRLLNEWEKNGVLEPKPVEPEVAEAPVALATLKKVFHAQKQKIMPAAPADNSGFVAQPTLEIHNEPFVTQSAGARAYAELVEPMSIKSVSVAALDGKVAQSFVIERKQQA